MGAAASGWVKVVLVEKREQPVVDVRRAANGERDARSLEPEAGVRQYGCMSPRNGSTWPGMMSTSQFIGR
jgi:hypothetical protein